MTVAGISFAVAEADRKTALQVTDAAGIEFRGKLVFIVLNSLFWDFVLIADNPGGLKRPGCKPGA